MVSDNLSLNAKPCNNLVKYEMCGFLTIGFNYGHILYPFCEVIDNHNNMVVPPNRGWVAIHKINPPLNEWTDSDKRKQQG